MSPGCECSRLCWGATATATDGTLAAKDGWKASDYCSLLADCVLLAVPAICAPSPATPANATAAALATVLEPSSLNRSSSVCVVSGLPCSQTVALASGDARDCTPCLAIRRNTIGRHSPRRSRRQLRGLGESIVTCREAGAHQIRMTGSNPQPTDSKQLRTMLEDVCVDPERFCMPLHPRVVFSFVAPPVSTA